MSKREFGGESRFMSFAAATADYIGTGALYVPVFERQIMDETRKRGTLLQRVKTKAATGHPTRYFEKVAHDTKEKWINPRRIDHALDTEIDRIEHSAYIRAIVDGISFNMYDREVTAQQGLYGNLQAQDLSEVVSDMLDAQDRAVWTGGAKSLMDSDSVEYCSVITQITKTGTIARDARLTTAIMQGVAMLMYNKKYNVRPTAVYMNPLDKARLDTQELAEKDKVKVYDVEVIPGIKVTGIMTVAGILPIITDIYCPVGKIAIVNEDLLERQYITTPSPRLFQLGTEKDLATRYIAVLFDTFIVRAGSYGHLVLTIDGETADTVPLNTELITVNKTNESTTGNAAASAGPSSPSAGK